MSHQISYLLKRVCGLDPTRKLDGRLIPDSLRHYKPVVVMHDRRISAGIFSPARRRRKSVPKFRVVAWRTYQIRGVEKTSMTLHRDELETAVSLMNRCSERLSIYE